MQQLTAKSFLINCSAEQSGNWFRFREKFKVPREEKKKKKACQPDQTEEKMRNNLLIICRSFDPFDAITVVILLW